MKKILFPFRFYNLKDVLNSPENNPKEFLYGMYELMKTKEFNVEFLFEPRAKRDSFIRLIIWMLEQPFARAVKLGIPFGTYWFHKDKYKNIDTVVCINDAISFSTLFWKKFGFIDAEVITLFQSLPERYNKYFKQKKIFIWIIKKLLNESNKILVLSSSAKYELSKVFDISLDKIEVFYFGADLSYWEYREYNIVNRNYILAIGNDMNRDYDTLFKALSKKYKIIVVSNKKINSNNIKQMGGLSNAEVKKLYYGAKIVVTPSIKLLSESSGLSTTVQAMSCGTPVLISDSLPMRELFKENKEIFYYEPENIESLRNKIDEIIEDEHLLQKISLEAREYIEINLNSENMAKQLEKIIYL
jgi:glycosyltransferase involved in cell wall biosynthesis